MIPVLPSNYDGQLRLSESVWLIPPTETVLVAPANSSRIYIAFMAGFNSNVAIYTTPNAFGIHGFLLDITGFIKFTWKDDGILPTLDWYIADTGATGSGGTVWEQFYTPNQASK